MKKPEKYVLNYTFKNQKSAFYGSKYFCTKAKANIWIKKNKSKLYWYRLVETDPKSTKPRPIVKFEPNEKFVKKTGTLQTYFETGMECLALVFYEDGIHGGPNPNFNPSKPEDRINFRNFSSFDGMTNIESGQIIEFEDGTRIGMLKDLDFAKKDGYRLSFYPQGFSKSELIELFTPETVKVSIWIPIKIDKQAEDLRKFIRGPF